MNSSDGLSVYGYVRQNFEQKCLIHEIIRKIIEFFKKKDGFLYVCGRGTYGRLGIRKYFGYKNHCVGLTRLEMRRKIADIAAFGKHTMLVDYEGKVWAFGACEHGALGNGISRQHVKTPQSIHLTHRAISVCVGQRHSLILTDSGAVLSCGKNARRQLGHDDHIHQNQSVPKVIEALKEHRVTQISAGAFHNGALSEKGDLFMWGNNKLGQCGVGEEKGDYIKRPTMIKLNEKVNMIECGNYHSLLITMNNLLCSFGAGYKLGHDTKENKYVPTIIQALRHVNIVNVAGGYAHTLCVDDEFNVWAFGRNYEGQCAQPKNIYYQTTPKQIAYFTENNIKARDVAAGDCSSCVISQNDECFVFGNNKTYQIGLRGKKGYFVPIKLLLPVQKVSIGEYHSAFISDYKKE